MWLEDHPELVVASMDVISTAWQGPASTLLRRSDKFWEHILRPLFATSAKRPSSPSDDAALARKKRSDQLRAKVQKESVCVCRVHVTTPLAHSSRQCAAGHLL